MNPIFFLLIILLTIFIVSILYYYLSMDPTPKTLGINQWPPENYMKTVGSLCPDYWFFDGNLPNGQHVCRNKFNLPVHSKNPICNPEQKIFSKFSKWPPSNNDPTLKEACQWINECGPEKNIPAAWIGVSNLCN